MSSVVISGDTSGAITLAAPSVSGTNTITLPAATGTVMVSGNMPAFSAYKSSSTAQTNGVATAVVFDTEHWDTASCYNSSTGVFTPTVAGYYQLNACVDATNDGSLTQAWIAIYKNGAVFKYGAFANARLTNATVSAVVYANGTTDYFQIYYSENGGVGAYGGTGANAVWTWFDGSLVRTA